MTIEKAIKELKDTGAFVMSEKEPEITMPNLYKKLSLITNDLQTVAKNLEVAITKNAKYKAVGEADVLRAVKPLENKYRIYSFPVSREIVESNTLESVDYNGNTKKQLFVRIKVVYRFVDIDKPDEFVDITSYGDGIDSGDKSVGKAMTYADKYALLKAYKIVTGEDPDQEASQELKSVESNLDKNLLIEAENLNIDLNKVAVYLKKNVSALTNDDLKKCIEQKKSVNGGVK